jgi:hypothetical protein
MNFCARIAAFWPSINEIVRKLAGECERLGKTTRLNCAATRDSQSRRCEAFIGVGNNLMAQNDGDRPGRLYFTCTGTGRLSCYGVLGKCAIRFEERM